VVVEKHQMIRPFLAGEIRRTNRGWSRAFARKAGRPSAHDSKQHKEDRMLKNARAGNDREVRAARKIQPRLSAFVLGPAPRGAGAQGSGEVPRRRNGKVNPTRMKAKAAVPIERKVGEK